MKPDNHKYTTFILFTTYKVGYYAKVDPPPVPPFEFFFVDFLPECTCTMKQRNNLLVYNIHWYHIQYTLVPYTIYTYIIYNIHWYYIQYTLVSFTIYTGTIYNVHWYHKHYSLVLYTIYTGIIYR